MTCYAHSSSSSGLFLIVAAAAWDMPLSRCLQPYQKVTKKSIASTHPRSRISMAGCRLRRRDYGYVLYKSVQIWRRYQEEKRSRESFRKMSPPQIEKEIAERHSDVSGYLDAIRGTEREQLASRLDLERTKLTEQTIEITAFGTISSGKSSLLNALVGKPVFVTDVRGGTTTLRNETDWPGYGKVRLIDTPGLGEIRRSQKRTPRSTRPVAPI